MIEGDLYKPGEGRIRRDPPFRVTVPSVDVDWKGFVRPQDEDDEERRFIIVPCNQNGDDDKRWVELYSPYDDDEREWRPSFPYGRPVNPDITINWESANCLGLLRNGTTVTPNGWTINAKQIKDWNWPIRFLVDPRQTTESFRIFVEGQEDEAREKALDTIHGRIVNVDIDVDSDYDGDIDDADEPLEETQGGFVGVGAENLTPINLALAPSLAQLPGKLTLSATQGGDKIRIWLDAQRTTAVPLPKVWQNGVQIPPTLYVEGVTPSANVRDVELTLEYDEVPEGTPQNKQYLFKCSDKIALTVVKANIDGEYNRDGIPCDHECESAKVDFLHAKGMVIVANDDDDAGDQRPDNDGDLQPGEYEIQRPDGNSGIIDGASDLRDIHAIQITKLGLRYSDIPAAMKVELSVKLPETEPSSLHANHCVRLFDSRTLGAVEIIGPKYLRDRMVLCKNPQNPNGDISLVSGVGTYEIGIEGIQYGKEVIVELSIWLGSRELSRDSIRLLVAPFIVLSNLDVATKVYIGDNSIWGEFPDYMEDALAGIVPTVRYDADFTQDFAEIGASKIAGTRSGVARCTIAGFWGQRYASEISPDTGYFKLEAGNVGGNIEASPPLSGFPFGRIIAGNTLPTQVKNFLASQCIQVDNGNIIELPVDWLRVKHVDEIMTIIPAQTGFRVLMADLESAIAKLRQGHSNDANDYSLILAEYDDPRNANTIAKVNRNLAEVRKRLARGLGILEEEIIKVPVLFRVDGGGGGKDSYLPNMVNMLVVKNTNGQRKLIIPHPISMAFVDTMEEILANIGYGEGEAALIVTDDPDGGPHEFGGEVHCASNARRELQ